MYPISFATKGKFPGPSIGIATNGRYLGVSATRIREVIRKTISTVTTFTGTSTVIMAMALNSIAVRSFTSLSTLIRNFAQNSSIVKLFAGNSKIDLE